MRLRSLFHRVFGWRILAGPFAGMHYVGDYAGSLLPPKLLGTYERELHAIVDRLIAQKPPLMRLPTTVYRLLLTAELPTHVEIILCRV